jgi:hypothetical protein
MHFLQLYSAKKTMMNIEFLQNLDFVEISKLSRTCSTLANIIDANKYSGNLANSKYHLKYIAAKHLLGKQE